ncbi:Uncharacterized protein PBTT_06989 [Plasmodiophora brassicae]|uniref:Uncharacterized protein n=1 Tax=Plasmodiophora brassicae TaxID=37360 RepID=A0A0G4J8Z9_PLABS|nr:hypothetical protein PBRA_003403 [Plasmodiophora brassicae]
METSGIVPGDVAAPDQQRPGKRALRPADVLELFRSATSAAPHGQLPATARGALGRVPFRTEQKLAVECWLNEKLGLDPIVELRGQIDTMLANQSADPYAGDSYILRKTHLDQTGLSRSALKAAGLAHDVIDRLHRGLFVYTTGLHELLSDVGPDIARLFWKAYWRLADRSDTGSSENGRLVAEVRDEHIEHLQEVRARIAALANHLDVVKSLSERDAAQRSAEIAAVQTDLAGVRKDLYDTQTELDAQRNANIALSRSNAELDGRIARIQKQVASAEQEIAKLRHDKAECEIVINIADLRRRKYEDVIASYEKRSAEMQFNNGRLLTERADLDLKMGVLFSSLQDANLTIRALKDQISEYVLARDQQHRKIVQVQNECHLLTVKLQREAHDREKLDAKCTTLSATIATLTGERAALVDDLGRVSDDLARSNSFLETALEELRVARQDLDVTRTALADHQRDLRDAQAQVADRDQRIVAQARHVFQQSEQLANLRRLKDGLCRRVIDERIALRHAKRARAAMAADRDEMEQRLRNHQQMLNEGREQLRMVLAQNAKDVAAVRHELRNVISQRDEQIEINATLRAMHEESQKELANLTNQLSERITLSEQLGERVHTADQQRRALEDRLGVSGSQFNQLENRHANQSKELCTAIDEITKLNTTLEQQREALLDRTNERDQLSNELAELKEAFFADMANVKAAHETERQQLLDEIARDKEERDQVESRLQEKLAEHYSATEELERQVVMRVQQCTKLAFDLQQMSKTMATAEERHRSEIGVLEAGNAELKAKVDVLTAALTAANVAAKEHMKAMITDAPVQPSSARPDMVSIAVQTMSSGITVEPKTNTVAIAAPSSNADQARLTRLLREFDVHDEVSQTKTDEDPVALHGRPSVGRRPESFARATSVGSSTTGTQSGGGFESNVIQPTYVRG